MSQFNEQLQFQREKMKEDWDRVLPSNELLFDRWEKARFIGAGEHSSLYDSCAVFGDVRIGSHTWVGPFTVLDGTGGGLVIGDYCNISAGVQIYTHDTVQWALSGGKASKTVGSTRIGNRCYIAPMSLISLGVTLGDGCVVAAGSFVNRSFPEHTIIAGTPARKIGDVRIDEDGAIVLDYTGKKPQETDSLGGSL